MSKPEFVYTTYIETSAERLWQALTDGDFTERYWFVLCSLKPMLESGTALAIPSSALGIEGLDGR
jgi:hypothetical protein